MTHREMWAQYRAINPAAGEDYEPWVFGASPDELAELVRTGVKTATSSAAVCYEIVDEPLPKAGEYSVILDSGQNAVCVIRTTKVRVVPFDRISEEYARLEGEGDRSLAYWRQIHEDFFRAELGSEGLEFSPEMLVVCEEFEVVFCPEGENHENAEGKDLAV